MRHRRNNHYTLYGIIAGIAALMAVAMFVYPRYDRVQNYIRSRSSGIPSGGASRPRSRGQLKHELRTENDIMDSSRTRMDNL